MPTAVRKKQTMQNLRDARHANLSSIAAETVKFHIALDTKRRAINELLSYMKRRCSGSRQGEKTVPFAFVCCPKVIREEVKHIGLVAGKLFAAGVVMSTFKSLGKMQCVHFADLPPLNEFLNG